MNFFSFLGRRVKNENLIFFFSASTTSLGAKLFYLMAKKKILLFSASTTSLGAKLGVPGSTRPGLHLAVNISNSKRAGLLHGAKYSNLL